MCLLVGLALSGLIGCGKQPIAIVGQTKITRAEFLERLEKDAGRQALIGMINRELINNAFASSGLTLAPEEVQERLKEIKEQSPSPEEFAKVLAARGMTEQDLVDAITFELKLRKLCTKDVKVTEDALRKFFEQYKDRFSRPELINYSEIVVGTQDEANKVAAELKKPGASFENLAKQHSISPLSRDRGGKLSPMTRDALSPEPVKQAVLSLKPGQISAPIKVDDRFYILRLDSIQPAQTADLVKDRKRVEEAFKLNSAKQPEELLAEIRQKAVINIVDPKYADLNEVFRPQPKLPEFGPTGAKSGGAAGGSKPAEGGQQPAPAKQGN